MKKYKISCNKAKWLKIICLIANNFSIKKNYQLIQTLKKKQKTIIIKDMVIL